MCSSDLPRPYRPSSACECRDSSESTTQTSELMTFIRVDGPFIRVDVAVIRVTVYTIRVAMPASQSAPDPVSRPFVSGPAGVEIVEYFCRFGLMTIDLIPLQRCSLQEGTDTGGSGLA